MKLLSRDDHHCQLSFTTQEKDLLLALLPQYPKLPADYHQTRQASDTDDEAKKLLEDALADHRQKTRAATQSFLEDKASFQPAGENWTLTLTHSETEWLLQVLNDLRVGSWIALGSPTQDEEGSYLDLENITPENLNDLWTMEICGALQHELLCELHGENPNE